MTSIVVETFTQVRHRQAFLGESARLVDDTSETLWNDRYTNDPWKDGSLGVAPGLLAFISDAAFVTLTIEVLGGAPPSIAPNAHSVLETGFAITGPVVACSGYLDEPKPVAIPVGEYRARVTKRSESNFHIQLFPGRATTDVVSVELPTGVDWTAVTPLPEDELGLVSIANDRSAGIGRRLAAILAIGAINPERAMEVRDSLVDEETPSSDRPVDDQLLVEVAYDALTATTTDESEDDESEDDESEDDESEDDESEDDESGDDESEDDESGDGTPERPDLIDASGTEGWTASLGDLCVDRELTRAFAQCNEVRAYHFPDEPRFIELVATSWGVWRPGTRLVETVPDVTRLERALAFAHKSARALKGIVHSTDIDVGYHPFVAPVASTELGDLRTALGLRDNETLLVERPVSTRQGRSAADNIFFAHNDDVRDAPRQYHSRGELAVFARLDREFREASSDIAFIWFGEGPRYTQTPVYVLAWLPGFVAGVASMGCWT